MKSFLTRVGPWPLAITFATLAACTEQAPSPTAPPSTLRPHASTGTVFTVTNKSDGTEVGSLRWAASQVTVFDDVIRFDPSLAGDTIVLSSELYAMNPLTIEGPAIKGITISGVGTDRVIRARNGATLRNVGIKGGGGVFGHAVWAEGDLVLEHSTVWNNHGSNAALYGYNVTLVNSTVSGNTGQNNASAIAYPWYGSLTLINSTVARNGPAPGISPWGTVSGTPRVLLRNSILAHNGNPQRNCATTYGVFVTEGRNISTDNSCGTSAVLVADPMLAGLASNGGPTMTESFGYQSPALNAGINCGVSVDQRYVARDAACDIGAFEFTDFTVVTLTIDPNASIDATAGSALVTGTVTCSRGGDQFGVRVLLEQQKGGKTPTVVQGTGTATVACTTSAQPWSAVVTPSAGTFGTGAAAAAAQTIETAKWITPITSLRSVKIVRPRR